MSGQSIATKLIDTHRHYASRWQRWVFSNRSEILDGDINPSRKDAIFSDLERISRITGITASLIKDIDELLAGMVDYKKTVTILELCAGNGWLSKALARHYQGKNCQVSVVAQDVNPDVIASASDQDVDNIVSWETSDALNLSYDSGSFDLVVQVQSLHHFMPDQSVKLLSEAARIGRHVYIYDVRRTPLGFVLMKLFRPLASKEFIHDASLSHRRAYSMAEIEILSILAGVPLVAKIKKSIGFSLSM